MIYRSKTASYYRARSADCENAAHDAATTATDQAILLHCAAQWYRMADESSPPTRRGNVARAAELRSEAETLRKMLAHVDTDAVSRQVLELINELEAQAKELNNGDAG